MVSLISASSPVHISVSHQPLSHSNPPIRFFSSSLVISPLKRQHLLRPTRKGVKQGKQNVLLFEFTDNCGVVRMCKREGEGDQALELELLEFMKNSKNPEMFPSKNELIECGRADLADAIEKTGGWMSMGWEDDGAEKVEVQDGSARNSDFSFGQDGCKIEARSGSEVNDERVPGVFSFLDDSSSTASSSSSPSLEIAAKDESGIEGILNRLERQRSLTFGLNLEKNGGINHISEEIGEDEQSVKMLKHVENICHAETNDPGSLQHHVIEKLNRDYSDISSTGQADTWRTWSIQRAGNANREFEAAEIDFHRHKNGRSADASAGEIIFVTTNIKEPLDKMKDLDSSAKVINQNDVKNRLQHLELELSSVLSSLRSNTSGLSKKAKELMSEDLRRLSDASEFQENETMNSQEKLRSLRAKLAVLEGKMTLAITNAEKVLDVKQKRIDDARRALQLLRTTFIVWPNSGSEVLLAGSYDGWATQRRMEKSSTGIFSLSLKLYPGQHEIKFIVDGSWKVDPLRPIVNNGGFENNLLIVA